MPSVYFVLIFISLSFAFAIMGDECDWTGSGLTHHSSAKGVTPVYLRCAAGRIKWMYPRGALRIVLRLPSQSKKDFRACVRISTTSKPGRPITKIYLEGPRSLIPLYESELDQVRCFDSKHGRSAIYMEATDEKSVDKQLTEIEYDLQPLSKGYYGYDPHEECRPCTPEEMAHIFCTSDLVSRGRIDSVAPTSLTFLVTKLIRHVAADEFIETNNSIDHRYVNLTVPEHCAITHGVGEFVFMARRKLGQLSLLCAPRVEKWSTMVTRLNDDGKTHCVLRT